MKLVSFSQAYLWTILVALPTDSGKSKCHMVNIALNSLSNYQIKSVWITDWCTWFLFYFFNCLDAWGKHQTMTWAYFIGFIYIALGLCYLITTWSVFLSNCLVTVYYHVCPIISPLSLFLSLSVFLPEPCKRRKKRCPYSKQQIRELEREFLFNVYINKDRRMQLSRLLCLTDRCVHATIYEQKL